MPRSRTDEQPPEQPPQPDPPLPDGSSVPPVAPRRPHVLVAHGDSRTDDWYWLNNREDPQVIAYLEAENDYADRQLAPTLPLQEELFDQIRSRIRETDAGPPAWSGGWWYFTRTKEGLQYPIHC